MDTLQAKVIQQLGGTPEVVSIGANPFHPTSVDHHIVLPNCRYTMHRLSDVCVSGFRGEGYADLFAGRGEGSW